MKCLSNVWSWLSTSKNQKTLAFIGGGVVIAISGAWQLYLNLTDNPTESKSPDIGINYGIVGLGKITATADNGASAIITTGNVIGINLQEYEAGLKRKEQDIRDELAQEVSINKDKSVRLEKELDEVHSKLKNSTAAFEEYKNKLTLAYQALDDLKREIPQNQIKNAQQALAKGRIEDAQKIFQKVLSMGTENSTKAAYQLVQLTGERNNYNSSYAKTKHLSQKPQVIVEKSIVSYSRNETNSINNSEQQILYKSGETIGDKYQELGFHIGIGSVMEKFLSLLSVENYDNSNNRIFSILLDELHRGGSSDSNRIFERNKLFSEEIYESGEIYKFIKNIDSLTPKYAISNNDNNYGNAILFYQGLIATKLILLGDLRPSMIEDLQHYSDLLRKINDDEGAIIIEAKLSSLYEYVEREVNQSQRLIQAQGWWLKQMDRGQNGATHEVYVRQNGDFKEIRRAPDGSIREEMTNEKGHSTLIQK